MKLTAKVKLLPNADQYRLLLQTLEKANAACDYVSQRAWETQTFGTFRLQKLVYSDVKAQFELTAQMVVRVVSKVGDAYKLDKKTPRMFRKHGAIAYDDRILKWYTALQRVSIWSVGGRLNMAYQAGERQLELLCFQKGESDLVFSKGAWYLLAACDIPDPTEQETENALGVDMGVVNIAATSDGDIATSAVIERTRLKQQRLRRQLQKKNTRSARRHLRKLAGQQRRFQADVNHCIAKKLVQNAEHTKRAIAVETLTGIRARTRVRGADTRAKHSNWAFAQLRFFLSYKAARAGIPVIAVNPAYTSQRCFVCGHIERANRTSQSQFLCKNCGHADHADVNAAKNIAWAAVIQPIVASEVGAETKFRTVPPQQQASETSFRQQL
jgi:putative transposase